MSSGQPKLRFGVTLPTYPKGATVEGFVDVARAAEDMGFSSAWTTDHVILPKDEAGPYESIFEPLLALAYVAGLTNRLTLGLSVVVVPQRNGIVLAKQLATLDHLCRGNLIVGVGAGWNEDEFRMLGYGDRFSVRGAQLDETIEVWRHLWTTPEKSFSGRFYDLPPVAFGPLPLQEGGPAIWVGGSSAAARKRAGRVGAAWHPVGISAEDIQHMSPVVREAAELVGRSEPVLVPRLPLRIGTTAVEAPTARRMQTFVGSPEQMVEHLQMYVEAGVTEVVCLFSSPDSAEVIDQMTVFSTDVMPAFS
jgi:probable F420-dependent oxidoreductase